MIFANRVSPRSRRGARAFEVRAEVVHRAEVGRAAHLDELALDPRTTARKFAETQLYWMPVYVLSEPLVSLSLVKTALPRKLPSSYRQKDQM